MITGEAATIYKACEAMCDIMKKLGIAVDGGKDSLSMAARVEEVDSVLFLVKEKMYLLL